MMKNSVDELREMREEIAELLSDKGFGAGHFANRTGTLNSLSKKGINISGPFGARFCVNEGLVLWNKAQRNSGKSFTLEELREIELALSNKFLELVESGRLK